MPIEKLPMDMMIQNKIASLVKKGKVDDSGVMKLDEFNFPHAVHVFGRNQSTQEGMIEGYEKIYDNLGISGQEDAGATIVVTPHWMFVTTIDKPYENIDALINDDQKKPVEVPVYHDGLAYAGIVEMETSAAIIGDINGQE